MPVVLSACDGCELDGWFRRSGGFVREYFDPAADELRNVGIEASVANRGKSRRAGRTVARGTRSIAFPGGYLMFSRPRGPRQTLWVHLEPEALHRNLAGTIEMGTRVIETVQRALTRDGKAGTRSRVGIRSLTPHVDFTEWAPWPGIVDDICKRRLRRKIRYVDYGNGSTGFEILGGYGVLYLKSADIKSRPDSAWIREFWGEASGSVWRLEFTSTRGYLRRLPETSLDSVWRQWMNKIPVYRPEPSGKRRRFRDRTLDPFWASLADVRFPSLDQHLDPLPPSGNTHEARVAQAAGQAVSYLGRWIGLTGRSYGDPIRDFPAAVRDLLEGPGLSERARERAASAAVRSSGSYSDRR